MKLKTSLTAENINQNLLNVKYAVRGPLLQRALQIETELAEGVPKPFERVVRANIGDCHALGQRPFTFIRQVLALVACPQLIPEAKFPADVKVRARELLKDCINGSVGAYSLSLGLGLVRARVTEYLRKRDCGIDASSHVYLGNGASDVIAAVLTMFAGDVNGKPSSVMIPIPQYPLFSGTLQELGIIPAEYYLVEEQNWALCPQELRRCWSEASRTSSVRALVVINPGNPTGQVLSRENMVEIIKFAYKHNLFLLADEVYQENIVCKPFHSFKKVMLEMGTPYSAMELASFGTASKGWAAECGLRCGYVELLGLSPPALDAFHAVRAVRQCSNVLGQCALDCVMKPPAPGDPSYPQFSAEMAEVRRTLAERAATAYQTFNTIPGYSCRPIDGAMFAFPRIELPPRAVYAARAAQTPPDDFYCQLLLEHTGICVVPGSGFGQRPGTYHFRTTILHEEEEFKYMMDAITAFHHRFLHMYA